MSYFCCQNFILMSHHETHHQEEKKSVNFWGPVIGGLVIWIIILIIETNLDGKKTSATEETHTEQTQTTHH